jgi:hypothetical protein
MLKMHFCIIIYLHDLCVTWNWLNSCLAHPLCFILKKLLLSSILRERTAHPKTFKNTYKSGLNHRQKVQKWEKKRFYIFFDLNKFFGPFALNSTHYARVPQVLIAQRYIELLHCVFAPLFLKMGYPLIASCLNEWISFYLLVCFLAWPRPCNCVFVLLVLVVCFVCFLG